MIRRFISENAGGLFPLAGVARTVYQVDGVQYRVWVTWLRRSVGFSYHTPNLPRDVRRARAEETRRLHLLAAADSLRTAASEIRGIAARYRDHRFQTGDLIPHWVREIPDYVLEVRDGQGDVWRRPVTEDERYFQGDRSQTYDWVQESSYEPGVICGHTTNDGITDHPPLVVTAVTVDNEDAHHAA